MNYNIVIFASGSGSNAQNLIEHFNGKGFAEVRAVFSNRGDAGVVQKAKDKQVDVHVFDKKAFYESIEVIELVKQYKPDIIVLAGFLWLVPVSFLNAFEGKIINLHPSLLPKFGGKGMYGQKVHAAVLAAGEKETGVSIHIVDEEFDRGKIIHQVAFPVLENDTVESLEKRIHDTEHTALPEAVEKFLKR